MTGGDRRTASEREADRQAELGRQEQAGQVENLGQAAGPAEQQDQPPAPGSDETAGRPEARDDRTPEQRAGAHTEAAREAARAMPTTPPAASTPEPVEVRKTTITTLGEVQHETRPGFDAGGTPVIPNSPPINRLREIGDYPRSHDDAVFLQRYRDGEIDEYGRAREDKSEEDESDDKVADKGDGERS